MRLPRRSFLQVLTLVALMLVYTARDKAQTAARHALITQAIDENSLVTLAGNTRLERIGKTMPGRPRTTCTWTCIFR